MPRPFCLLAHPECRHVPKVRAFPASLGADMLGKNTDLPNDALARWGLNNVTLAHKGCLGFSTRIVVDSHSFAVLEIIHP